MVPLILPPWQKDLSKICFLEETLLLSAKDFPDIRKDDVVKISSADDDTENHLVIKVWHNL